MIDPPHEALEENDLRQKDGDGPTIHQNIYPNLLRFLRVTSDFSNKDIILEICVLPFHSVLMIALHETDCRL